MENPIQPIEIDDAVVYAHPSKEKALEITKRLIEAVAGGTMNPLEMLSKIRFAQSILNDVADGIMPHCVDEASKYGRTEAIVLHGAEMKVKEAGTKWNYENCGDRVYERIKAIDKENEEQRKMRESFLKTINGSQTLVDEETGEIYTINPPSKTSKTIVEVRIK